MFRLLVLIVLLTGCGGADVIVKSDFPEPLVDTLPLHIGVYYSEEFRQFVHEEKEEKAPTHRIETGATQVQLFDRLFTKFFSQTSQLTQLPTIAAPVKMNGVIAPEVEELQFTFPRDTNSNVFEVWVKYKIKLYSPEGDLLLDWSIPAYGKTPKAFMKSREEALQQATVVALRDAGAHFTISLSRNPKLQSWLDAQLGKPPAKARIGKTALSGQ